MARRHEAPSALCAHSANSSDFFFRLPANIRSLQDVPPAVETQAHSLQWSRVPLAPIIHFLSQLSSVPNSTYSIRCGSVALLVQLVECCRLSVGLVRICGFAAQLVDIYRQTHMKQNKRSLSTNKRRLKKFDALYRSWANVSCI